MSTQVARKKTWRKWLRKWMRLAISPCILQARRTWLITIEVYQQSTRVTSRGPALNFVACYGIYLVSLSRTYVLLPDLNTTCVVDFFLFCPKDGLKLWSLLLAMVSILSASAVRTYCCLIKNVVKPFSSCRGHRRLVITWLCSMINKKWIWGWEI